ncbi:hypothetical protein Mapa_014638 [Marchantia paleacea]|nr:hypothetical protein Mapa_014638 [Marchantia paleacea]
MDGASNHYQKAQHNRKNVVPATPRCTSQGYFERADQILSYPKALNSEFLSTLISEEFFETHFPDSRYEYEALIDAANDYPKSRFGMPSDLLLTSHDQLPASARENQILSSNRKITCTRLILESSKLGSPCKNTQSEILFTCSLCCSIGLSYIDNDTPESPHCQNSVDYPCVSGKSYHPRGPMKMCWNYNYGQCGVEIGEDLLTFPERVSQDPLVAFKSALWFWCTKQWNKPSCHAVMLGLWEPTETDIAAQRLPGFGLTTNIINGGQECGKYSVEAESRLRRYEKFCTAFGVEPGQNLSTDNQTPFG